MWQTKKLNEVCDIQSGLWKGKKGPYTSALVLRNTNFTASGVFDYSNVVELEVEAKQLAKREVIKNDIILEKSGGGDKTPVGRVCIHNKESKIPFSLSNFTARIRVLDSKELNAEFLHKFLYFLYISGKTEPMQRHSTGIRNLQLTQYKDIDVPLPPIAEQERIVAKLDAAFAEIDEAVENANTKEFEINKLQASILCASLSTNAIKSELTPITELCNAIYAGGDAPAKENISKVKTKKYKTPIYSNGVKDSGLYGYTTSEPRTFQPAITISARGTIGHIELRNKPFLPIVRLIVLEPKIEKIDLTFLKYALLSMKIFSSGSSIPQLTVPMLKKMNLSLPPLAEQKQIVKKLNTAYREFENACILIEKSRQSYKSLKSAILAQELQSSQGEAA